MNLNNINVKGIVEIRNGNKYIRKENHIVNMGIRHLISAMIGREGAYTLETSLYNWHCEIGDDTSTTTSSDMISLTSVISSVSDSKSGNLGSGSGYYEVTYHFTWNSGSVTGTLGEAGLFLYCVRAEFEQEFEKATKSESLFSRFSSADADFSSFVIDDGVPLTIDWTLRFEFV